MNVVRVKYIMDSNHIGLYSWKKNNVNPPLFQE